MLQLEIDFSSNNNNPLCLCEWTLLHYQTFEVRSRRMLSSLINRDRNKTNTTYLLNCKNWIRQECYPHCNINKLIMLAIFKVNGRGFSRIPLSTMSLSYPYSMRNNTRLHLLYPYAYTCSHTGVSNCLQCLQLSLPRIFETSFAFVWVDISYTRQDTAYICFKMMIYSLGPVH